MIETKGESILIKQTIYLFLAIFVALHYCKNARASDYDDAAHAFSSADSRQYELSRRAYRELQKKRRERIENEEAIRRQKIEDADQARSDERHRPDDADKGSQIVGDNHTPFSKRKDVTDDFSGAQFRSPDFAGADFHKSSFTDLDLAMRKFEERDADSDKLYTLDELDMPKKRMEDAKERAAKLFDDVSRRERVMPGADWAPSKLDPIQNGGFTTADDNGAPVPYKLNGHVDMQRKPAWEAAD